MLKWMGKFFQYLDRFYVKMEKALPLYEKGMEVFKMQVFESVKKALRRAILIEINKSREGELINELMIKGVVEIFIEIGKKSKKPVVYEEDFEVLFNNLFQYIINRLIILKTPKDIFKKKLHNGW